MIDPDRVGWWGLIAAVILLAVVAWHFTPYERMGLWWGPLGCGAAMRATHTVPKGCEPSSPCSCCDKCEECRGK